jgi:hypothetical protein
MLTINNYKFKNLINRTKFAADLFFHLKICRMKFFLLTGVVLLFTCVKTLAQEPINWTSDQLMEPADLSAAIKSDKNIPVILSIGPGAIIPHSRDIGMTKDAENMKKFKDELAGLPKDTQIVIYCGCCPFEHCPNIRPAMQMLKELKFTNYKLLDLPHNIKIDWINKGLPTQN